MDFLLFRWQFKCRIILMEMKEKYFRVFIQISRSSLCILQQTSFRFLK